MGGGGGGGGGVALAGPVTGPSNGMVTDSDSGRTRNHQVVTIRRSTAAPGSRTSSSGYRRGPAGGRLGPTLPVPLACAPRCHGD